MATSQKKKFPNGNFLKVKVPKWQLPNSKSFQMGTKASFNKEKMS